MYCRGTYFIETYGCEMNRYDSSLVENLLQREGYIPAGKREAADILLINTCSVRRHAEERVFSLLSQYKALKVANPLMKIFLLGCMAAKFREGLLEEFGHLDYAVGPDGYRNLPELLEDHSARGYWAGDDELECYTDLHLATREVSAGVAVMRGCNNFCSYCVVPYVRGRERSRPVESIIEESKELAESGVREIILLGQNVNSYKSAQTDFPDLLAQVAEIEGIARVRFLTSHPKDLSEKLISVMSECDKVMPHLHLPAQSGSNRILKLMNRNYRREHYINLVNKARSAIPALSITSDLIAGFPTETEIDFQETLDLVREVGFDDAFTYRYSLREGTKAAQMADDIPEEVKLERLGRLISAVRAISRKNLQKTISREFEILIERPSKKESDWWRGRTEHNRVAVLPREDWQPGDIVRAAVDSVAGFTLRCHPMMELEKR